MLRENGGRGATEAGEAAGFQPGGPAANFRKFRKADTAPKTIQMLVTALSVLVGLAGVIRAADSSGRKAAASTEESEPSVESLAIGPEDKARLTQSLNRRKEYELRLQREPAAAAAILPSIVANMQTAIVDDAAFSTYLSEFDHVIRIQEKSGGFPAGVLDQSAESLLRVYEKRQKVRPGWYLSIVDFAIKRSTSTGVRRFILAGLDKEPSGEQDQILNSLYWSSGFRGDREIYDRVLRLYGRGKGDPFRALAVLVRLDRGKAFPIVRKRVKETRSVAEFNKLASILSTDRTAEAMELTLSKVKDFPVVPMDSDKSPTEGIYTEPLLDYIRQAEDDKLEVALEVLPRTPARIWSYAVLTEKLRGKSARSRLAVMRCLRALFDDGDFVGDESRDGIVRHLDSESDEAVQAEGRKALEVLERRLKDRK